MSTGNRAIDNQHKYLIDIINELGQAIMDGKCANSLKKIIHLLQYYTEWHFCREEDCMLRNKCPKHQENKDAHKQFLEVFAGFKQEFADTGGSEELARRMFAVLTGWLVNHIQGIDTSLEAVSANDARTNYV